MTKTKTYHVSILLSRCLSAVIRQKRPSEVLFMLAMIALPFSAQGVEPFGITLELSYLFVLLFSIVYFGKTPQHLVDRQDLVYLLFLFVAVMSLSGNAVGGRIADTGNLGSGLRFSARPVVHLTRFLLYYVIYKAFKRFLSRRDSWMRHQHLFYKGLLVAASITAIYGSYQFFAQRFDWPLRNINNLHKVGAYPTAHYLEDLRKTFYTVFATFGETKTYVGFLLGVIPLLMGVRATIKKEPSFESFLPVSKSSRRWLAVLIGTLMVHFIMAFSRTGYVALALLTVFVFLFISRKAAVLMCVAALLSFTSLSLFRGEPPFSLLSEFWLALWDPQKTGGAMIIRFRAALQKALESPILGYGLGNVYEEPTTVVRAGGVVKQFYAARDLLGQLLPSVGILGTILFLVFLGSHVWLSYTNLRNLDRQEGLRSLVLFSLVGLAGAWAVQFISAHVNATLPWVLLAENAALNQIVVRFAQQGRQYRT